MQRRLLYPWRWRCGQGDPIHGEAQKFTEYLDLIRLEQQIHDSLGRIRAKKEELFLEQPQKIKEKEGWSELFKIATTRRAVTGNSNVLEKIVEFAPS
ncbi:hypothetical protein GOP47_0003610 [Adiantum capillus-veneris]|uniref:Uncharacterized protein n=1 Tax=Adiantum capillus-veneris TaxID=13818 RepID=A0A9D4V7L7_ADICA|nr:hypothetical protein GOP47_0003610 [Adiantum capillus-veneris]